MGISFADREMLLKSDGGARRDRTDDLMLAKHALYQLSYGPKSQERRGGAQESVVVRSAASNRDDVVGPSRFELLTSRLSGVRSNQLSYGPMPQPRRRSVAPRP